MRKRKSGFPKPNSIWTSKSGEDVIVQMCCNLGPSDTGCQPIVVYRDRLGNNKSHSLDSWDADFRPSQAQETINNLAMTVWTVALNAAIDRIGMQAKNRDLPLDDKQLRMIESTLRHVRTNGATELVQAGLITGINAPLLNHCKMQGTHAMACAHDALVRAYPGEGALFAVELWEKSKKEEPDLNEQAFFLVMMNQYAELSAKRDGRPVNELTPELLALVQEQILDAVPLE